LNLPFKYHKLIHLIFAPNNPCLHIHIPQPCPERNDATVSVDINDKINIKTHFIMKEMPNHS